MHQTVAKRSQKYLKMSGLETKVVVESLAGNTYMFLMLVFISFLFLKFGQQLCFPYGLCRNNFLLQRNKCISKMHYNSVFFLTSKQQRNN